MSNILKQTVVRGHKVSTIQLPFSLMGMLYETMVFTCDEDGTVNDWSEVFCDRYKTKGEALEGHEAVVLAYENKTDPEYMAEAMDEVNQILGE
jgi:hypothetical protein